MAKKKYIGQLISFKYKDRKTLINGFVLDYSNDWTLLKYNPIDYQIDGYYIINHKNLEGYRRDEEEKFTEKVLKLKGLQPHKQEPKVTLTDLPTILQFVNQHHGIFALKTKSEKAIYLGKLIYINGKDFAIDFLDPKGKWAGEMKFRLNEIRVIEFDTDYINSLKIV